MRLDPTLLEALVAVANTRSFTRAARQLNRTQSAVSTQIRKLESAVNHRLFERSATSVSLTEDGEVLLGYAHRILDLSEEARRTLDHPRIEGVVRVGVPDDYAHHFLADVLSRFGRAHPRVRLEVVGAISNPLLDMFEAGELDVCLITRQLDRAAGDVMLREPLVWVGARGGLAHTRNPVPLAVFPDGCRFRASAIEALAQTQRPWTVSYCSQGLAGGRIAVDSGHAVTVTLQNMVPDEWRVLGPAEGFPPLPEVEIELCQRPGSDDAATQDLVNRISDRFLGQAVSS